MKSEKFKYRQIQWYNNDELLTLVAHLSKSYLDLDIRILVKTNQRVVSKFCDNIGNSNSTTTRRLNNI